MRAKIDKLREDANKKLMAVLTSDQQAQLESLKGEKVEIDMSQLRGRRRTRRPGRRSATRRGAAIAIRKPRAKRSRVTSS